jgi:hypothetical protein
MDTLAVDTLIPFGGHWADEKYLQTLQRTKSPMASQDDGSFLFIPSSVNGLAYPYVYHEGGAQFRVKKHDDRYFLTVTEEFNQGDSSEIKLIDNGNILEIWDRKYIKLNEPNTIAEKVIFSGQYKFGDRRVTISEFGVITGLDDVSSLSVNNDYIGPGMDFDLIYLHVGDKKSLTHTFSFSGDTLKIFDIKCNEAEADGVCMDMEKGNLKWTLVRITGHNSAP